MVASNNRMSSFPLPGQSLSVLAQIEARKQMQQKSHNHKHTNNNATSDEEEEDDPFTTLATRKSSSRRQRQDYTSEFFPTELKSMSTDDDDDFDIDRQIVMTDSSTSTFTNLFQKVKHAASEEEEEEAGGEEVQFRDMKQPAPIVVMGEEDHRDDDAYETDEYSSGIQEEDYPTEVEEETTTGELTEGDDEEEDDDSSSVGSARSEDSFNTLLVEIENNDVSIREVNLDTTSMDRETAEDMSQLLQQNTSISTIRISCKRLQLKEGKTRKHSVLSTLLSGIQQNTTIESIEVEDTDITLELARTLSQLCARKQSLKNVAFISCQFVGSALAILLLGMQHSQSIRNVIFQSCDLGDQSGGEQQAVSSYNVEIIASALPLMNLTSLSMVDVNFPSEECLHYLLENIEQAKELKLLDLSQNKLDVRSVLLLCKSMNRQNQISRLVLSDCSLDNACIKELGLGLRGYDPLTNLDVSKNRLLSDRGAAQLKDLLKGNSKLTKLNVAGCSFSGSSLDALEAALRYNNSFLKTFVSVSTGQQIFDVVDALANLGVGGEEEEEDEEEEVEGKRRGGGSQHRGDDDRRRRRRMRGGKQQQSESRAPSKKTSKSSVASSSSDVAGSNPTRDDLRTLFRVTPPDDSSFDRSGNVHMSTPQRDIKSHSNLQGQKIPRSPPPPPPPPPPRQDLPQNAKDTAPIRRNENIAFFDDQVNFDEKSSYSSQSAAKSSSQRINVNGSIPINSSEDFFSSGSGQGSPQYASPRRSMPQYEFSATSSSQSGPGTAKPKYAGQRKNQAPKIDKVIAQLSPSRRDVVRNPKGRSPRGSTSSGKRVML